MYFLLLKKCTNKILDQLYKTYLSAFSDNVFQVLSKNNLEDFFLTGAKVYVLKKSDNIIAYAILSINEEIAEIISIGVKKTYQQKGHGKYLINNIIKNNENISKINLEVSINNQKAISFYEELGFCKIGVRKNYYLIRSGLHKGKKIDALIYALVLN